MIRIAVKTTIAIILIAVIVLNMSCVPSDPLPETLCTSGIYDNTGIFSTGTIAGGNIESGGDIDAVGSIYVDEHIIKYDAANNGGYYHEHNLSAFEASPGSSGATITLSSADTLGGFQLDADNEYIYCGSYIESDWDTSGDITLDIFFEINIDNSGGAIDDVVIITVTAYSKSEGDSITNINTASGNTIVGAVAQYTAFEQSIIIGDAVATNIERGDSITYKINIDTTLSDVDNIIINTIEAKYPTFYPAVEVN